VPRIALWLVVVMPLACSSYAQVAPNVPPATAPNPVPAVAYRPGVAGVGYPTCLHCPEPQYTDAARKAQFEGTVVLQTTITPDGHATNIQLVREATPLIVEKKVKVVCGKADKDRILLDVASAGRTAAHVTCGERVEVLGPHGPTYQVRTRSGQVGYLYADAVIKGPGLALEQDAIEAVKTWTFKPALGPNGMPVAVITPIEITFRLK
jgi:hypothetical protein